MNIQSRYFWLMNFCFSMPILADDLAIDKLYHPYVQALERELEWRMISADNQQLHRLGLGTSLSNRLFIEAYLIAEEKGGGKLEISDYELEAKWQLSEQGEYAIDWGMIVELEKKRHENDWEFATGLLMEKEWGQWVGSANVWVIYEWGDTIKEEVESALALQLRYRYSRHFEPAIEFYSGQNTRALGSSIMGDIKLTGRKKWHWEAGIILGLDDKTPDNMWRLLSEFEF